MSTKRGKEKQRRARSTVFNEAVARVQASDFQAESINECKAMALLVAPMIGPDGAYKLIIDGNDPVAFTRKGSTVTKTIKTRRPVTQMLAKLATAQDLAAGDGTKTAVLLAGLLLEKAQGMFSLGIHPQIIAKGFSIATRRALELLDEDCISLDIQSPFMLEHVLTSVMTCQFPAGIMHGCLDLLLRPTGIPGETGGRATFMLDNVQFRTVPGKSIGESEVVKGIILNKQAPTPVMPRRIECPKVLLVQNSLDFFTHARDKSGNDCYQDDLDKFLGDLGFVQEYYDGFASNLREKNVDVILCQKRIPERLTSSFAAMGIIALELVGEKELKLLGRVLNVNPVTIYRESAEIELGVADLIEFRKIGPGEMCIVTADRSNITTFLLRGVTVCNLVEIEETLKSALTVATRSINAGKILPGGGAIECEIAHELQRLALDHPGKLQIVITEFGKAFESIPGYIISNSGEDPLDVVTNIMVAHEHGSMHSGFDSRTKKIVNVIDAGILDGYQAKRQAILAASDLAIQIVRTNELFLVKDRQLFERSENETKEARVTNRNEQMRNYFKKHEVDLYTP